MSRITKSWSPWTAANRSIAALASATSPSAPRSSSVSTRTPVAGTQYPSCPASEQIVYRCAHLGMAPSRSPRLARSRAVYTSHDSK